MEPTLDEDLEVPPHLQSARAVLRRGLHESPELRKGLGLTVVISLGVTASTLITPVLVQQIFDHGFDGGFRPTYVYTLCAAALATGRPDVPRQPARRSPSGEGVRAGAHGAPRPYVRAHPSALDRGADRGEARRVRRPRDRRRRHALAVHGVGRDRVDHLDRARVRRIGTHDRLLVAAGARGRPAGDPAPVGRVVAAGPADTGVRPGAHARRPADVGGLGERSWARPWCARTGWRIRRTGA